MLNDSSQYRRRGCRNWFSALEKNCIVEKTYEKSSSVIYVARLHRKRKCPKEGVKEGVRSKINSYLNVINGLILDLTPLTHQGAF